MTPPHAPVQYTARFNNEKLCKVIHRLNGGEVPRSKFNMRLAPEDMAFELTG